MPSRSIAFCGNRRSSAARDESKNGLTTHLVISDESWANTTHTPKMM